MNCHLCGNPIPRGPEGEAYVNIEFLTDTGPRPGIMTRPVCMDCENSLSQWQVEEEEQDRFDDGELPLFARKMWS